ncbi:MAG: hypothetical protein ACJA0Q_000560, partial [Saprospiraceae bacterium]
LMQALADNISKFEQANGPIKDLDSGHGGIPMNFGGPTAQA